MKPCAYCGDVDTTHCRNCGAVRSDAVGVTCASCKIEEELRRINLSRLDWQSFDTFGAYVSRLAQARRDLAIAALCDELRVLARGESR